MLYNARKAPSPLTSEELKALLDIKEDEYFTTSKITIQGVDYVLWAAIDYKNQPVCGLINTQTGEMYGTGLASPAQAKRLAKEFEANERKFGTLHTLQMFAKAGHSRLKS